MSSLSLLAILILAAGLRFWRLGELSYWYDEVVFLRLAETASPSALLDLLREVEATRAPLHPLLLQAWIKLFGGSEAAARALSALCGIATVGLVFWIGQQSFGRVAGLWAASLVAVSPPLVYYSREARMYSLLVMLTCLCWGMLFSLRASFSWWRSACYALAVTALLYCHPLGMLMAGALGLASILFVRTFFGSWRRWLAVYLAVLVLLAPWIRNYLDHDPEFLSGRLPLRFLLGTPIGFIGGNFLVLLAVVLLIGWGLWRRRPRRRDDLELSGPICLLIWLVFPPLAVYTYSWISHPIFGPSRYTLYVAPAYLILVAQAIASLPFRARLIGAVCLALLVIPELRATVYAPGLKADWRAFSDFVRARKAADPAMEIVVFVQSTDPARNLEVETARYYLARLCRVLPLEEAGSPKLNRAPELYVAAGAKQGAAPLPTPDLFQAVSQSQFPGLTVYRVIGPVRRGSQTPAASGRSSLD
jgi:uncharacterized membrane protein